MKGPAEAFFASSLSPSLCVCPVIDRRDKSSIARVELSATSTDLLREVRCGDSQAWQQLAAKYTDAIYRWARRAGLPPADAQDVTQEVLGGVVKNLPRFRHDRAGDTFRGWLRKMTQFKVVDYFRRKKRDPGIAAGGTDHLRRTLRVGEPPPESDPGSRRPSCQQQRVREAMVAVQRRCKPQNWTIFLRIVVDEASPDALADEFGVNCAQVYNVKSRCLRRLREELIARGVSVRRPE